jgi:hypothetical protein
VLLRRISALLTVEHTAIFAFTSVKELSLRDELAAIYENDLLLRGVIRGYFEQLFPQAVLKPWRRRPETVTSLFD